MKENSSCSLCSLGQIEYPCIYTDRDHLHEQKGVPINISPTSSCGFLLLDDLEPEIPSFDPDQYTFPLDHDHFSYPISSHQPYVPVAILFQFFYCFLIAKNACHTWFLIDLLTIDSILCSTVYMSEYYEIDVSPYLFLEQTGKRYSYFSLSTIFYYYSVQLIWIDQNIDFYYLALALTSMPYVVNKIINLTFFRNSYYFVYNKIHFFIKYIISKKISGLINRIGIQY